MTATSSADRRSMAIKPTLSSSASARSNSGCRQSGRLAQLSIRRPVALQERTHLRAQRKCEIQRLTAQHVLSLCRSVRRYLAGADSGRRALPQPFGAMGTVQVLCTDGLGRRLSVIASAAKYVTDSQSGLVKLASVSDMRPNLPRFRRATHYRRTR